MDRERPDQLRSRTGNDGAWEPINIPGWGQVHRPVPGPKPDTCSGEPGLEEKFGEKFGSAIVSLLDRIMRKFGGYERNEVYECCGVTVSQWYILSELEISGSLTMSELAERMGLAPSTVTRILDNLVRNGLVSRERSETDRRLVQVSLTAIGAGVAARLKERTNQYMSNVLAQIPEEDREDVYRALRILEEAIDKTGCC